MGLSTEQAHATLECGRSATVLRRRRPSSAFPRPPWAEPEKAGVAQQPRPAASFGSLGRVLARSGHARSGPARPPQAARRLGPARARHAAGDLDRDLAAVPAGGRLEGEQLAVAQPGPRLARRVDRAELELPPPDADAPGSVPRDGTRLARLHRSEPGPSGGRLAGGHPAPAPAQQGETVLRPTQAGLSGAGALLGGGQALDGPEPFGAVLLGLGDEGVEPDQDAPPIAGG